MKKKDKSPPLLKFMIRIFPNLEKYAPAFAKRLFVHIFFIPARYKFPAKELQCIKAAQKTNIVFKGRKVVVYQWGEGKPVLMMHGWMGRATQYRKFIKPFNKVGYAVIAFDAPAHGKSAGLKSHMMYFVQVIELLAKEYTFEGIIGHSLGGVAGLHVVHRGTNIPKLIMIGSPTIAKEIVGAFLRRLNGSRVSGDYFEKYIHEHYGHPFEHYSASYIIQFIKNQPLLLIYDDADMEVDVSHGSHLKELYPAAELFITKGLGHTRILKDENVIKHCLHFLQH